MNDIHFSNNRKLRFDKPLIMGILNLSPESFYSTSSFQIKNEILNRVEQMIQEGMDILDIGAMSSKPGAQLLDEKEEWARLSEALPLLRNQFPDLIISLDAYRTMVISNAFNEGIDMVNDISAGQYDPSLPFFIQEKKIPYLIMHMRGTPATMQSKQNLEYADIKKELIDFFQHRLDFLQSLQMDELMIDPGFGFSKNLEQNYIILKNLHLLAQFNRPIVVGLSRKSMIYKLWEGTAENALEGSIAANMWALMQGANILRVHDVKATVHAVKVFSKIQMQTV